MKKLNLFLGYLAMVLLVLYPVFKLNHWPGANWLMMAGAVVFCLGFLPSWLWMRHKLPGTATQKLFNVFAVLSMFLLVASLLVRTQHWCPGIALACAGYSFLILAFITALVIAFKEEDPVRSLINHTFTIVGAIVLSLFVFLELTTMPKNTLHEFKGAIDLQNQEIRYFEGKSDGFYENMDQSGSANALARGYFDRASEVNARCDSLVQFIRSLGEEMMLAADGKAVSFDSIGNLCRVYDNDAPCELMCGEKDSLTGLKYEEFRAYMTDNTNSRGKEILETFFPQAADSAQSCAGGCRCTLICQLIALNADILHIRMLQAETLNFLQTMQAKTILSGKAEEPAGQ